MKFRFFEHTADIKFRAFGKTLEEVFKNSALAMFRSMYNGEIKSTRKIKIKTKGKDLESLLYSFLEEFLFFLDSEEFFASEIREIKINQKKMEIEAEVWGDDARNYKRHLDIKAVTYNEMFVKKEKGKWVSQVVLDV